MHDNDETMQDTMHDGESTMQDTMYDGKNLSDGIKLLLLHLQTPKNRKELQESLGLKSDEYFRKAYLRPALEMGVIEMTLPDQRQSKNQKYRLTAKGADLRRKITSNR